MVFRPNAEALFEAFCEDIEDPEEIKDDINLWPGAQEREVYTNLPPSMQPITYRNFTSSNFPEWGWR